MLDQVIALARLTQQAGLQGVVASAQETAAIRQACGPDFQIVTPGIRGASAGAERNDQSRTMGPAEAIKAGASFIVVGRPIIAAQDPRAAAAAIIDELRFSGFAEVRGVRGLDPRAREPRTNEPYFAVMMKCPRRFIAKHGSVISMQSGSSSPLLIASIRSAAIPRLTR